MQNDDTIHLLKECDSGTKMAVASIDDVMEHVIAPKLQELLSESKEKHENLFSDRRSRIYWVELYSLHVP